MMNRLNLRQRVISRGWRIQPLVVPLTLLIGGAFGLGFTFADIRLEHYRAAMPLSGCYIKGNISFRTGEKIYHVPGQQYYDATRISLRDGERWFCSEEEARQAGWRRSRV